MTVSITIEGCILLVEGRYTMGEGRVGLSRSFEVSRIGLAGGDLFDLLLWTEAQKGRAMQEIEIECLKKINER